MYKVIHNNIVIDVLKSIKYLRYLPKSKRAVSTDKTSAHCILASDGRQKYHVQGMPYPNGSGYKTVLLIKINQKEYDELSALLGADDAVCADNNALKLARAEKIKEMSEICHQTIIDGVCVIFGDNKLHHFELTIEDQINLLSLKELIANGAKEVIYHETGELCQIYSAKDISLLIEKASTHKTYHTTYFNALKYYINNLYDIDKIKDIKYGVFIPDEYCSDALKNIIR